MSSETNPFQPPTSHATEGIRPALPTRSRAISMIAWPFVFGANMIIPLTFGWGVIDQAGFWGVLLASTLLLAFGWILLIVWPPLAWRLSLGSIFTALLQIFPILHLILGMIAFEITVRLGQATAMDDLTSAKINTELGGFLITSMIGTGLLLVATGIGALIFLIFRWR